MLKVQLLLAERDIVDDLSTVDSDGLADLLLGGRLPKHHFISPLAVSTSNPQTPTIHMVIRLQNWASGVSNLFKVRFAVMESREPGVAVEASVGLEAGVHVVVEPPLDTGFELLRAILALEVLGFVSPHYVVVQLQFLFSAKRTNLAPF